MPDDITNPNPSASTPVSAGATNSIREDSMKCIATTQKGNRCSFTAKYGDYCGVHKTAITMEEVSMKEKKLEIFKSRKERELEFINTINDYKVKVESLGLKVNVRATNGDIRIMTTGDNKLVPVMVQFPVIEEELESGEWAVDFAYSYSRHNPEDNLIGWLKEFMKAEYAHRNQDEQKVNMTFIRKSDDSGWRKLEKFATVENPKGYKRARNLWHTSPVYKRFDHVVILRGGESMPEQRAENTLYIKMFTGGFTQKYDGDMIVSADLLKEMNGDPKGCLTFDTGRISYFDGVPVHIKGDVMVAEMDGPDIIVHTENVKYDEFGFKPGVEGALITMNPKKQYKAARTSPQFDASMGVFMQQMHREFPSYTYYEVALQEALGRRMAETILGHDTWGGFDLNNEDTPNTQTLEYKNAAEAACDTLGTIIGIPSLLLKSLGLLKLQLPKSTGGKDIKVRIPNAAMLSMRSTAMLELADLPVPTGNTISLSPWGSHISDDVLEAVLESTGGSDLDDTWSLVLMEAEKDFVFHGYEFTAGEVVGLWFRFPMGGRIEKGVVGVEYWISHIATDRITRKYMELVKDNRGREPMMLDPDLLPPHVLELPEPKNTEPTTGELEFMDQVVQSMAMQKTYDKVANAFTLLVHRASMNGFKLHTEFTMEFSPEFLIDVCTKTFGAKDLQSIHELIDILNKLLMSELREMGEVGEAFAARTGRKNLPVRHTNDWIFDLQVAAYNIYRKDVEKMMDVFERNYMRAWGFISPSGNVRSQSQTPNKQATWLINRIRTVQSEMAGDTLNNSDYLVSYTKVAAEIADKITDAHIMELFRIQGNPKTWSKNKETNYIGHILFNGVLLDKTLKAVVNAKADGNDPMGELLDCGIYDSILERLDPDVPMDQEIIRMFMRVASPEDSYKALYGAESVAQLVEYFGGSITLEDLEPVSEALQDTTEVMGLADVADQLAAIAGYMFTDAD